MLTAYAYAESFHIGFPATLRLLLSKGIRELDAEEFAQAAWSRGWEARHQLKDPAKIIAWVNGIAIHMFCSEKRRSRRFGQLDETKSIPGKSFVAPLLDRLDASRLLQRCPALDRSLLAHRYAGGWAMDEIAKRHGMTSVATRVRIHRSKAAMRQIAQGEV
jgi:DNA-directed RNA polymerase specialized sigma24 family protein